MGPAIDATSVDGVRTFVVARGHDGALFDLDHSEPQVVHDEKFHEDTKKHGPKLGQAMATSIAGNDLLSSCLYTAGICAGYAGKMAPASLLAVSAMLYLFRFVYGEVVTAMPVNGGSYTALSNTTSKRLAALAAACSIISYIATAVVSAESAVNYVQLLWPAVNNQAGTLIGTIVVLGAFAALNLMGMSESATVATTLFLVHFFALCVLIIWSFVWAVRDDWALFKQNMDTPYPDDANWAGALYFGYSAALLGITGFETAANYVEEMQSSGTYVAVLRNMWVSVAVMNPIIGLLALAVMPVNEMYNYSSNLLGPMAAIVGGNGFQTFICIDGFLVLSGSVLTAYVGIGGLIRRMSQDRILPSFLLTKNSLRGTYHYIILGFFAVCSSLLLALDGDVDMLGSVYNIAFLSVMSAFACSCMVLKFKRPRLPRKVVASWGTVMLALITVLAGLIGNIIRQPVVLAWFALYYGVVFLIVQFMFNRVTLLVLAARLVRACLPTDAETARNKRLETALKAAHSAAEKQLAWMRGTALHGEDETAVRNRRLSSRSTVGRARLSSTVGAPGDLQALQSEDHDQDGHGQDGDGAIKVRPSAGSDYDVAAGLAVPVPWLGGAFRRSADHDATGDEEDGYREMLLTGADTDDSEEHRGFHTGHAPVSPTPSAAAGLDGEPEVSLEQLQGAACGVRLRARLLASIATQLRSITHTPIVFFAKTADLFVLNKAMRYVRGNESSCRLVVVHVADDRAAVEMASDRLRARAAARASEALAQRSAACSNGTPPAIQSPEAFDDELRSELQACLPPNHMGEALQASVRTLNEAYPKMRTSALLIRGTVFGPGAIRWVSRYLGVAPQSMFMGMPDERFSYPFAALGGVRIITRVR